MNRSSRPLPRLGGLARAPGRITLLALLAGLGAEAASSQALTSGVYRARAGAQVHACGGISGACFTATLEGTLRLVAAAPAAAPGSGASPDFVSIEIVDSHLFIRSDDSVGAGAPLPRPGDLPLVGLSGQLSAGVIELEATGGFEQEVDLTITPPRLGFVFEPTLPGVESFLLSGLYFEGCCDRYGYSIGSALFERVADADALRLDGDLPGRFDVRLFWREDASQPLRPAVPVALDNRSGAFWIFRADNPEVFVKLVDACGIATPALRSIWLFASGLTNLEVVLVVTDRLDGATLELESPAGAPFEPIQDTSAFDCSQG